MLGHALFFKERVWRKINWCSLFSHRALRCTLYTHLYSHCFPRCDPNISPKCTSWKFHNSRKQKLSTALPSRYISPTKLDFLQIWTISRLPFRKQEVQRGRVTGMVLLHKDNWDKAGHLSLSDILVLSIGGSSGEGYRKCSTVGKDETLPSWI